MEARWGGVTRRVELSDEWNDGGDLADTVMFVLLRGLRRSAPYLPMGLGIKKSRTESAPTANSESVTQGNARINVSFRSRLIVAPE